MARTRAKDHDDKREAMLHRAAIVFSRDGYDRASMAQLAGELGGQPLPKGPVDPAPDYHMKTALRQNTTLCAVATDAPLNVPALKRVAIMAQDGLARAIRPVHSPLDGDVVFALSTGEKEISEPRPMMIARLGELAASTLARAIARGVHAANAAPSRVA